MLLQAAGLALLAALSPTALLIAAVYLGSVRPRLVTAFYLAAFVLFGLAFVLADAGLFAFAGLGVGLLHAIWLIVTLNPDDPQNCLRRFRENSTTGWIIFAGLVADALLRF